VFCAGKCCWYEQWVVAGCAVAAMVSRQLETAYSLGPGHVIVYVCVCVCVCGV